MGCENCNSLDNEVRKTIITYKVKGKNIEIEANRRFCTKCGSVVYDYDLEENISRSLIEKYNKTYGIDPKDIIKLRKNYSLSQEKFAKIIGCAKKTLISYEKGVAIPNDIYMITLKTLLENPEMIYPMIDANLSRFDTTEYQSILNKIHIHVGKNLEQLKNNDTFKPTIFNGFTELSLDKLKNLFLILCQDGIAKTKLLKEIFYCDFLYFKENCVSITGMEYVKLPYGPVPDDFSSFIELYLMNDVLEESVIISGDYERHTFKSKQKANKSVFTKEELEIVQKVKKYFKNYNSSEIVDYVHTEKAYIETKDQKSISYEYAMDISLDAK